MWVCLALLHDKLELSIDDYILLMTPIFRPRTSSTSPQDIPGQYELVLRTRLGSSWLRCQRQDTDIAIDLHHRRQIRARTVISLVLLKGGTSVSENI